MSIPLPQYAKIKDNYCIAYFGNNKEYLIQLKLLRPYMESTFPGIQIYLSCKEDSIYLLKDEERIILRDKLKENKHLFGYIRELLCDMKSHPIEEFMEESKIPYGPIRLDQPLNNKKCTLLTNGISPVSSLTNNQIELAKLYIKNKGYQLEINGETNDSGWIVGVENEQFYQNAASGKSITLIPTGFGENLFKKLFPGGEILKLPA
jgi:predicted RNA-binding protein